MTIFLNNQIFREFFLWNLVDSNHVNWIFSPAHIPYLSKFHCWSEWGRTTVIGTRIRGNSVILRPIVFFFCTPRMIRTLIKRSVAAHSIHWTMGAFVVEAGLKPAIFALRGRWLNQFVYSTIMFWASCRIRTNDQWVTTPLLYQAELKRQIAGAEGLKPPTFGFGDRCSVNWTIPQY